MSWARRHPRLRVSLIVLAAAALTVVAGRWGKGLFTRSEFVHFSVNYPTLPGHPTLSRAAIGGPWAMLPDDEWQGIPAGGLVVWGREGRLEVDLSGRSWLKSWLQPGTLLLSSHWIRNVGPSARRIALTVDLCDFPLEWVTFEADWDPVARASTRALEPGETFNMDWIVQLPPERRYKAVVCEGAISVLDADDQRPLARFPVRIHNGGER